MDPNSLRTLKILEEIEKDQASSQRDLAKALDVSLGLVNSFIKRLAKKGYFNITIVQKNRSKYALTARGISEKRRLTYEYIRHSYDFYKSARQKLRCLLERLEQKGVRHIVFYGISCLAEIAYISVQETSIEIAAIVDEEKQGQSFFELEAVDPSCLETIEYDTLLITADELPNDAFERLRELQVSEDQVVMVS